MIPSGQFNHAKAGPRYWLDYVTIRVYRATHADFVHQCLHDAVVVSAGEIHSNMIDLSSPNRDDNRRDRAAAVR